MFLGTYSAPSSYDRSILCEALSEFVSTPKMNGVPKWKKSQLNSQAVTAKEKLEKCEKDFYARDVQAMLAAAIFMLEKLEKIENPDKETTRKFNACTRNLAFCKEIFADSPD